MKPLKFLSASLLALSVSVASAAPAQTVVHITGSTAFRNATVTAITNILQPNFTFGYAGTSFTGANQHIFTGTTISNVSVIIKTSWSGAAGGVQAVVQQIPISTGWLTNTTPQSASGTPSAPPVYDPPAPAEISMDDGIQATTPLPNTSSPALTVQNVGVVTFKWLKNVGAPAGLTNMTPLLAQALWIDGSLPLSMWTGNALDTNLVYAIGRDPDSGTRKTAFLEAGIQSYVTSVTPQTVLQWEPTNASGQVNRNNTGAITGITPWPVTTVDNVQFPLGDAGYGSGGDLAQAMKSTSPYIFVTYLGLSDATSAESGGATELTWNGVGYSDSAIQNGQYTFWAYEQLGYLPNGAQGAPSANAKSVADELAAEIIKTEAALAGELLNTMKVSRPQEGSPVTP